MERKTKAKRNTKEEAKAKSNTQTRWGTKAERELNEMGVGTKGETQTKRERKR